MILALLVVAAEFDRRFSLVYSARDYYITDFPRAILGIYNSLIYLFSDKRPFLPLSYFPHHRLLEESYEKIRDEALRVYRGFELPAFHEVEPSQSRISDPRWKVFVFKWYSGEIEANSRLCPVTASLIRQIPEIHLAMFSVLEPKKYIPEHKGISKGTLRYHLGLEIPEGSGCYLQIENQNYFWRVGEGVIFDDTYRHQVYNNSDELRIVLFCDIERPLPFPLNKLNRFLCKNVPRLTHFIQRANQKAEVSRSIIP